MPVRPKSIVQFEMVYWAIILLGLASTALRWDEMMSTVNMQRMVATLGSAPVYALALVGVAIQLLLWYFVARRGSAVAKWIFVVLTVLGLLSGAFSLAVRGFGDGLPAIISAILIVLQVIAVVLLFRPDTKPWFGEEPAAA